MQKILRRIFVSDTILIRWNYFNIGGNYRYWLHIKLFFVELFENILTKKKNFIIPVEIWFIIIISFYNGTDYYILFFVGSHLIKRLSFFFLSDCINIDFNWFCSMHTHTRIIQRYVKRTRSDKKRVSRTFAQMDRTLAINFLGLGLTLI